MNEAGFKELIRHIKETKASGERDTKLGKALAKWKDIDIPIWRDGKWLLEGFIMTFKREREILNAIDPSVSPDLPPHLLDPAMIASFFNIPLEEFNWKGSSGHAEIATTLQRIEGKLDRPLSGRRKIEQDAQYVSLKEAADLTGLSYSHIRRAVLRNELPSSNVGTAKHPAYRIARTDLTAWMEAKKGESNVPPRSEMRGLIDRYFG